MLNPPVINPKIQAPKQLDEASKIVGVDINNYVFGEDKFNKNPSSSNSLQNGKEDKIKTFKGALTYGLVTGIGICLFQRFKGKGIKPDGLLSSFLKLFKK